MPKIVINPEVFKDQRDALAVAWNEGLRVFMEEHDFKPRFMVTPKQQEFFQDTAYAEDELMLKRTILARIITHDTSVADVTEEEHAECVRLLTLILRKYKGPDSEIVKRLLEGLPGVGDSGTPESGYEGAGAPEAVPEAPGAEAMEVEEPTEAEEPEVEAP